MECYDNYLFHHGVKGQKWGVRRYKNSNGALTEKEKARIDAKNVKKANKYLKSNALWKTRYETSKK